ncbi:MAG: A24 family peptidase [Nitrospira sp.]|nr:A24 family peptidase [Nitrospira sp.]
MITGSEAVGLCHFAVPAVGTLWAAVVDVARREIPDRIPAGVMAWAIGAESLGWLPFSWLSLVLGFTAALIVGTVGFWFKGLGGGDVKLLAVLGASLGYSTVWTLLFWTALAGGLLGVIAGCRGERELAFAPAIAMGVVAVILTEVLG